MICVQESGYMAERNWRQHYSDQRFNVHWNEWNGRNNHATGDKVLIGEGVSCFVCVCRGVVQVDPSVKQLWLGNGCGWWCEGFSKLIALPTAYGSGGSCSASWMGEDDKLWLGCVTMLMCKYWHICNSWLPVMCEEPSNQRLSSCHSTLRSVCTW